MGLRLALRKLGYVWEKTRAYTSDITDVVDEDAVVASKECDCPGHGGPTTYSITIKGAVTTFTRESKYLHDATSPGQSVKLSYHVRQWRVRDYVPPDFTRKQLINEGTEYIFTGVKIPESSLPSRH